MAQDDIQGQVVDGAGNPVSGAIVELTKSYQSSPPDEQVVRRTTTDSNGNYIFDYHPDGDGTTQEWHVSCYNYDGTAYVNSNNNPGVTADLPSIAIPDWADEDVYLQDDWGDSKLQDRDDGGTATYNDVESYYRPEWTIDDSGSNSATPNADDEKATVEGDANRGPDRISTEINLDLTQDITWEFTDFDISETGGGSSAQSGFTLYGQTNNPVDGFATEEAYVLQSSADDVIRLSRRNSNGDRTDLAKATGLSAEPHDIVVTRSSSGEWELIIDGTSEGTDTDTTFDDSSAVNVVAFAGPSDENTNSNAIAHLGEVKIF